MTTLAPTVYTRTFPHVAGWLHDLILILLGALFVAVLAQVEIPLPFTPVPITGQTFGVWGIGPGPYLVLPFLPPLTIRDGIGYAFDTAMTPYIYFIPWYANAGLTATSTVNERSLNLETFERVAESTIDLYGAVRNAYLQRRAAAIRQ